VHAIGFGALQKRHVPERWRYRLERRHQVAQHRVIGSDLVHVAPAVDQTWTFVERGVEKMGCTLQLRRRTRALR
jgi:hypothetical protein